MGDRAKHKKTIDWTAINLTSSIALPLSVVLHIGYQFLSFAIPTPVGANAEVHTLFIAEKALDYGVPFAGAFLLICILNLAASLKAAPIVAWLLFLCSMVLHVAVASEILAFELLMHYGTSHIASVPWLAPYPMPLPVKQAAAIGLVASWFWVVGYFVAAWWRGRVAPRWPTSPETVIAVISGVALPAAALAPFPRLVHEYQALYAAQEARFHELCKSVKLEFFGVARMPTSILFDPNETLTCSEVRDGQCEGLTIGSNLAQYLAINRPIEFVEFWEGGEGGKPRELKRCYGRDKCRTTATVSAVTAKYRVVTREVQSKVDEVLRLRLRTVTVDERETRKLLGRLQFVYSTETQRICAPGATAGEFFDSSDIIDRLFK